MTNSLGLMLGSARSGVAKHERGGPRMTTYDAVILGAGHNGLILQAYLGKAGMKTVAIERRAVAGGGVGTGGEPRQRGVFVQTPALFFCASTPPPGGVGLFLPPPR